MVHSNTSHKLTFSSQTPFKAWNWSLPFQIYTNLTTHHFILCVCTDQTMQAAAEIARIVQCQ
jgi:hypothetical protein